MPSLLSRYQHDASARSSLTLPLTFVLASVLAYTCTSPRHSLLTSALAWLFLCALSIPKAGARSLVDALPSRRLAWAAGAALVLAQVCERAVAGRSIWWAKALPLALLYCYVRGSFHDDPHHPTVPELPITPDKPFRSAPQASKPTLALVTLTGLITVYASSGSIAVSALGISYSLAVTAALLLVERAFDVAQNPSQNGGGVIYSAPGLFRSPVASSSSGAGRSATLLRDVSAAACLLSSFATVAFESLRLGDLPDRGPLERATGKHHDFAEEVLAVLTAFAAVAAHALTYGVLLFMLLYDFSLPSLWFGTLFTGSAFVMIEEQDVWTSNSRMRARGSKLLSLMTLVSVVILAFYHVWQPSTRAPFDASTRLSFDTSSPSVHLAPLEYTTSQTHPIHKLVKHNQELWEATTKAQSKTLEEAVAEYKRRYGIPPPPNFDKWFDFAKKKGVQMIDEYDTIYHSMLPFWALSPATIRARTREALGFSGNMLMGLTIRDGKALHAEGGDEWMQVAATGMMAAFSQYLPDMDLAFNLHDEPRVVVPHDELSRLVQVALTEHIPKAQSNTAPKNAFSSRPEDLDSGTRFEEVKQTRFNVYAHQPTWIPSRLSCSPDSPARALEDTLATDNLTAYAISELAFVYNHTAFSDICNSPSFSRSHGFFDRPNAFNVVHDLFPIFSQSKMSSHQDILYPSPWYWSGKVAYEQGRDMAWEQKNSSLWWRGSTTGGYSRNGGWRRQHRQQLVAKLNGVDTAKVYSSSSSEIATTPNGDTTRKWTVHELPRADLAELIDVHFTYIGQCDAGDCDAQTEYFDVVEPTDHQDAWGFKYLLDMDGNAFSGRFYAFLASHSLTFKMAVFREWHEEWIRPWVHYIPLSLRGDDALEAVRYFDREEEGQRAAAALAEAGRELAGKALRNEDFEAWFFRLLLE